MRSLHLIEFVAVGALMTTATGFVLSDRQCVVPNPCFCTQYSLVCTGANLTSVPTLVIIDPKVNGNFFIMLRHNMLSSLPGHAFENISLVHPTSVEIDLSANKIATIDPDAFTGVENTTSLKLGGNKLTRLPNALVKLENLQILVVSDNPLSYIDPVVMTHLGRSLTHFLFDMNEVPTWPRSIQKLGLLIQLQVSNLPFRYMPMDAFNAQSHTLTSLTITNTTLARMPSAVCHLYSLETLHIDFTSHLDSENSLDEPCSTPLKNLRWLIVDGGNLRTFPRLLLEFPSLDTLRIRNHDIHFIHSDVIPDSSVLYSMDLSNNSLPRIPSALNKLTNLTQLTLIHNQITSVEEYDLIGLSNLETLKLSNNPIEYITPNAFKNNTMLRSLYLDSTQLHLIPKAVLSSPSLYHFHFGNNNAECSCRLSYLKGWNVHLQDDCANRHDSIQNYISTYLPNCP